MNETIVMWAHPLMIALVALFFIVKLFAEEYSNKLVALLDKVLVLGLIGLFVWTLYIIIVAGTYQSTSTTSILIIIIVAMLLIIRKRFLHNLKETGRIFDRILKRQA